MKSYLYKILSLSLVVALFETNVLAKDYDGGSYRESNTYYTEDVDGSNYFNKDNDGYDSKKNGIDSEQNETREANYYPFTRSHSRIEDEKVIGIRIVGKKVVLFGENLTFFEEDQQDAKFSEFNVFSKYPRLISVDLSRVRLTKEVLENLRKFLPKTIKSLIFNSCSISNRDFEEFTDIIAKRKQLESLTILNPNMAEAETEKLIAAVGDLNVIRFLNLTLGELGSKGCNILTEVLSNAKSTLVGLNLGFMKVNNDRSYEGLLTSLGQLKKLKRLEYSVLESTENQVGEFFNSLANLKELTDLKVCFDDFNSHNGVDAYHNAEDFNAALKKLTSLESLDISNMNLPDSSLQTIALALNELKRLKTLNISGNPINSKTAQGLSVVLGKIENLVSFIANNCEMKDEAFSTLCGGLQNSSSRYMCFSGNAIEGAVKSFPIAQMKGLVAVDFANNKIKLQDVIGFMEMIPNGSKLEVVKWGGNDFKGISETQRIEETDKLKIWKREHGVNTLDLGI